MGSYLNMSLIIHVTPTQQANFDQTLVRVRLSIVDVVTCLDQPCKHGTCTDNGASFVCTCDEGYTGVTCDSLLATEETSELLLPEWLPYLEYVVVTVVSLTGLMVLGCLCLKCCQLLGVIEHKDDDEDKADRQNRRKDLILLQNRPKPMRFNSNMEMMF
ncbi:delta-like protein 1 [Saccostrea echinata]|uniref:delta-like protein 1 n=1 Tax=Saccostrea echinata TaxID=191078 RepID=UPI002A82AC59|nr:delta-like protein 1 [Saccostrea echinata]